MDNVEDLLAEYKNEVSIAATSFFAWKSINNVAVSNREVKSALNTNALSWNIITHSLLIAFYAALGRLFDDDRRSLTIHSFLNK